MGNFTSCCYVQPQTTKLLDLRGNLRHFKVPITAAELMLEQPGHVISLVDNLRRTLRFSAIRADDELSAGNLYIIVPAARVHSKVSESEMATLDSACERRRPKRRSSKVLPAVTDGAGEEEGFGPVTVLEGNVTGHRTGNYRHWKPVLEPICEGI